jgi:hypothetical protein
MAFLTGRLSPIEQGVITPTLDKNHSLNVKTITPLKIPWMAISEGLLGIYPKLFG